MNILLVNPYIVSKIPKCLSEPLGLMSIKAYLDSFSLKDVSTSIVDLFALGKGHIHQRGDEAVIGLHAPDQVKNRIRSAEPDIIGITCNFTMHSKSVFEIVALAKLACPEALIILGGSHVSLDAKNIMIDHGDVDFIVRGEGELVFKELVMAIKENALHKLETIAGICYRTRDNTIHLNPEQELIPDLNSLPLPDRNAIDMEFYKQINSEAYMMARGFPIASIMTSRGCPYQCIFCSTSLMWQRKWRAINAERVLEDIKDLVRTYRVKEIEILDDQFLTDKKRIHDICDGLIEAHLDLTLHITNGVSPWLIDVPLMQKLKKAGFYKLCFAVETGCQKSLEFIRKPVNLEDARKKIAAANQIGFWTSAIFIIGFPYETRQEILETVAYAKSCNLDFAIFVIALPYAGTELTRIFQKEGLLDKAHGEADMLNPAYDTTTMTATELRDIYRYAQKKLVIDRLLFILRPIRMFRHFRAKLQSIDDFIYVGKLFVRGISRFYIPSLMNRPFDAVHSVKVLEKSK